MKVRYKAPLASESDPAAEITASLPPSAVRESFLAASEDARFAMAVAAYAEILRESVTANASLLEAIEDELNTQAARDSARDELLSCFEALR